MSDNRSFKIERINKLRKPAGNLVGNGQFSYGPVKVNFRVLERKDGSGVFAGLPSHKGNDNNWYDDVIISTSEARKALNEMVAEKWPDAQVGQPKQQTEGTDTSGDDDIPF